MRRAAKFDITLRLLPNITVIVAVLGFAFSVWQYKEQLQRDRADSQDRNLKQMQAEQREFLKPLLEKQQSLFFEASSAAATIASTKDGEERRKATDTFWKLYWGPLVIVESKEVSGAMKTFGECLSDKPKCGDAEIKNLSLALASKLEQSMLETWNKNPENFAVGQFKYGK
jgi:hypothetical protein